MGEYMPLPSKPRKGRPPKHATQEATRRILETATKLFAAQGFAGTSVEQVAATCGAGKDTIYRRFPSKVALFEGVVEQARERSLVKLEAIEQLGEDPIANLKNLLNSLLAINMEQDLIALKRIAFSERVVFGKAEDGSAPTQPDPILLRLVSCVEDAQNCGAIGTGDAKQLAEHLVHSLVSIPTADAMLGGKTFEDPQALEEHFQRVWTWLIYGVKGTAL
ncbi:TetR/AcrR family transcriptional regulator [Labrenzia sp. CE80]|uniref:TetR/AcrR family transcriptional regulator n=1 Tax=Labrenzia sp. CE80 TaxID=1788986 RepID=UPI001930FE63|nr:TetR/AcrR family transcriptional regulator [Labrenzia sp. CE80]